MVNWIRLRSDDILIAYKNYTKHISNHYFHLFSTSVELSLSLSLIPIPLKELNNSLVTKFTARLKINIVIQENSHIEKIR